jgi:hypothetical protein
MFYPAYPVSFVGQVQEEQYRIHDRCCFTGGFLGGRKHYHLEIVSVQYLFPGHLFICSGSVKH